MEFNLGGLKAVIFVFVVIAHWSWHLPSRHGRHEFCAYC